MRNPYNNVVHPPVAELVGQKRTRRREVTFQAAEFLHAPKSIIYTSTKTLTTTASTYLRPPFKGGRFVSARAEVTTAPTSTLTWTILRNGTSIFNTAPTIAASVTYSTDVGYADDDIFVVDDYLQVQITTVGGAGGPMHVWIDFLVLEQH